MNEKNALMKRIRQLNLYLDTHPSCRRGLALFRRYKDMRETAVDEYIRRFGPIVPEQSTAEQSWDWVNDPWPWERS